MTAWSLRKALEAELMLYTRKDLEGILLGTLKLPLPEGRPLDPGWTKRAVIDAFISPLKLPELAHFATRLVTEVGHFDQLSSMIESYRQGGGVSGAVKNLIFAADGPKPELVLVDALNNVIEITANGQYCLVFDREVTAAGLTYSALIAWWRDTQGVAGATDRVVGLDLHARLRASLGDNVAEQRLFDAYAKRYRTLGFDIPALIPQVYLHYDPYTLRQRGRTGSPLARQRMDFLLLFSDRRRVVLEVDGVQHYSSDGKADSRRYAEMVAEDRRLRLAGYEIYRFGGRELGGGSSSVQMLGKFFEELAASRI